MIICMDQADQEAEDHVEDSDQGMVDIIDHIMDIMDVEKVQNLVQLGGRNSSDESLLGEFKGTMKYKMFKHGVFLGVPVGLVSFFITNPVFDMQYTYRKNALEFCRSKNRITQEQFNFLARHSFS